MRLSTRATYGLRLCFMLAVARAPLSAAQLMRQTDVTNKYVEKLLAMLKKGGVVVSFRGKSGGYELARDPADISVADILDALGDGFEAPECISGFCGDMYCPNRNVLSKLNAGINDTLSSITLLDMVNDYRLECKNQ